jgi:hypothetical protein
LIFGLGIPEDGCVRFFSIGPEEAWNSHPFIVAISDAASIAKSARFY